MVSRKKSDKFFLQLYKTRKYRELILKNKLPIEEWMKPQERFRYILKNEAGKARIAEIQAKIHERWKQLLFLCEETK